MTQNQMFYGHDSPGAWMAWFQATAKSPHDFGRDPQVICILCNIVFSLNSKQTTIQYEWIQGMCTFIK